MGQSHIYVCFTESSTPAAGLKGGGIENFVLVLVSEPAWGRENVKRARACRPALATRISGHSLTAGEGKLER